MSYVQMPTSLPPPPDPPTSGDPGRFSLSPEHESRVPRSQEIAAAQGQDELYCFLESWQEALKHMCKQHADPLEASLELHKIQAETMSHLASLEASAREVDDAAVQQRPFEAPTEEQIAKRDLLRSQVGERQKQIKVVIDRLREMQDDICTLTCVIPNLDVPDKITEIRRETAKAGQPFVWRASR